jgi:putative hydrolase of the HAD superfamily
MSGNSADVRPSLILFDIGGVIIDLDFRDARQTLESEYLMDSETFLALTRSGYQGEILSVTEKAMIGAIGSEEYLAAFQEGCKRPIPMETVRRLRVSMLGPERPAMLVFLAQLKQKIPIAAFTNTIALHWSLLTDPKIYTFPQLFGQIFASHLIGEAKPRPQAFAKVLNALGLGPEEVIFIDDSEINVSGATQVGIKGLVFKDIDTLRAELGKYVDL